MQATTSKGLKLFNHELPQTSGDSVLRVPLFKNWPLLADNSTAQGQGQGQGGKARRAANYVDVEPVDPAIRINVPHSCSRKAASAKHECFHAAFAAGQKLLIERVVSGLRLLPRSIRIPEHTRRFYYDLGSRSWESNSTRWFVENYPDSAKFSAEAYDMVGRFGATFPAEALRKHFAGGWRFVNSAVWIDSNGIQWDGSDMGAVVADGVHGVGGRSLAAASKAKAAAAERIPSFDLAKLLIERHGRREGAGAGAGSAASGGGDDFVVIKIDIEGAEWPIVERLIATGAVHVIDELFFECHIAEPAREMHPRCIDVINLFRRMGVVCHRWI